MKAKWTRNIFLAILISSCAANRIENVRNPDQLSNIKSGHFKGSELACPSSKIHRTVPGNKLFLSIQSITHRSADFTTRGNHKRKSDVVFSGTNNKQVDGKLLCCDGKDEPNLLDMSLIILSIRQPANVPPISPVTIKQKRTEIVIGKQYPAKYTGLILHQVISNLSKPQAPKNSEILVYLALVLAGLLSLGLLRITPELSVNISYWAALNPGKTRFIISVIQIMTGMAGLMLGTKLDDIGTQFSDFSKAVVGLTFLTSVLLYPVRKSKIRIIKRTYFKQKIHDLVLFLSGFLFMVYAGNFYSRQINSPANRVANVDYLEVPQYNLLEKNPLHNPQPILLIANQDQDKPVPPPKDGWSVGLKVFLTIITLGASVGLGYGVAVLSCELSCSGLNGLAIIVAIAGAALIAALTYFSLKSIFSAKHKRLKTLAPG